MGYNIQNTWQQIWVTFSRPLVVPGVLLLIGCTSFEEGTLTTPAGSPPQLTPPPNFTRGLIAQRIPQPLYPLRARSLGVEGWVMLGFSVNEDGLVVGNSIETLQEQPEGYFELSASNAARRMTFENTRGQTIEDVRYVFRYELEERDQRAVTPAPAEEIEFRELIPMRYITPEYPEVARELEIEGYVIVEFTVTEIGGVEDITIAESDPPGVFHDVALDAAARLRFEPRIVFDAPVTVRDVRYRFDWQLP